MIYAILLLTIMSGAIPIGWELYRGKFDFFNLKNPFLIYYIIQIPISGLATFLIGNPSLVALDITVYRGVYEDAFILSLLGIIIFQLGYYSQREICFKIPFPFSKSWVGNRYKWVAALYILLGFCAFFLFLRSNGGLTQFLNDRDGFRNGGLVGQGTLIYPATSLMALAALIYLVGNVYSPTQTRITAKSVSLLVLALVPAFFMGFRSLLLLPILQFVVIWNIGYRKIILKKLVLFLMILMATFTIYGISREIPKGLNVTTSTLIDTVIDNPELGYTVISRSKGGEVIAAVMNKLGETGDYDLGWRGLIEAVTILVPKSIWKEKPEASAIRFGTYFFAADFNYPEVCCGVSPTIVGELYWHFGWIGVLLGLFFLGRLAKVCYVTLQRNLNKPSVLIIYATFYTSFAMFSEVIQGYFNGFVLFSFVFFVTSLMLTMKLINRRNEVGVVSLN